MNPLSSIRLPVMPEMMHGTAMSLTPDIAPRTIPQYELGKLASSTIQPGTSVGAAGGNFESTLGHIVADASNKQAIASDAMAGLATGSGVPLHQVMLANEEASISFQLMVEVRNKLLESYQELMRMQV